MYVGCEKLKISPEGCKFVLEEDGTEVDEDVDIIELAGSTFILLGKDECWSSYATTTSASVPEPTEKVAALSEHLQYPLPNTSKIFHKRI